MRINKCIKIPNTKIVQWIFTYESEPPIRWYLFIQWISFALLNINNHYFIGCINNDHWNWTPNQRKNFQIFCWAIREMCALLLLFYQRSFISFLWTYHWHYSLPDICIQNRFGFMFDVKINNQPTKNQQIAFKMKRKKSKNTNHGELNCVQYPGPIPYAKMAKWLLLIPTLYCTSYNKYIVRWYMSIFSLSFLLLFSSACKLCIVWSFNVWADSINISACASALFLNDSIKFHESSQLFKTNPKRIFSVILSCFHNLRGGGSLANPKPHITPKCVLHVCVLFL